MIIIEMVTKMRRNDKKLWQNVAQEALGNYAFHYVESASSHLIAP